MLQPVLIAVVGGVLAGVGLTLASVALGTLVFGTYGYALFMLTPFVIGVITGYLANRKGDIGDWPTALSVMAAIALGGIALVFVALEGIVCILMAAPLAIGLALAGGVLGHHIALRAKKSCQANDVMCRAAAFCVCGRIRPAADGPLRDRADHRCPRRT